MSRASIAMACLALVATHPERASAQSSSWELEVLNFADTAWVHGGRILLDSAVQPNSMYGHPGKTNEKNAHHSSSFLTSARALPRVRITARHEAVRCDASGPRSCRIFDAEAFLAISEPAAIDDALVVVVVDHYFSSGNARQPVARTSYALTLKRGRAGWTVVSSRKVSET